MQINRIKLLLSFLLVFSISECFEIPKRDFGSKQYVTVELDDLNQFIKDFPYFQFEHLFRGSLDNHYVFSIDKEISQLPDMSIFGINDKLYSDNQDINKRDSSSLHQQLVGNQNVKALHVLEPRQLSKRAPVPVVSSDSSMDAVYNAKEKYDIQDPEFIKQWHIVNPVSKENTANVTGVWDMGITGKNVTVGIIDDGVDFTSEDLKDAFNKEASWDFNANQNLPMPTLLDDFHGTRCAGEISAQKNNFCGVGVAQGAKVAGIRILSGKITAEDEASAISYKSDLNDIYSCSWGPPDDGASMQAPPLLVQKSMVKSVLDGRGGKGSLYVFASGNGAHRGDSCNFDGYTNSIYSITVGAIDWKGNHPAYAESCAAVLTVAHSSGSGEHIHSTDIKGQCAANHGGTSAAAPLAAGIYALMLDANPNLTWRDAQYITIHSSVEINEDDGEWQETSLPEKRYSHKYGYGRIDAYRLVELAKNWTNVKPQAWYYTQPKLMGKDGIQIKHLPFDIAPASSSHADEDSKGTIFKDTISVTSSDLQGRNFEDLEHVTVTVDLEANVRGEVTMNLYSPLGRKSRLAVARSLDKDIDGFKNWTFMSVAHWGESAVGDWKLEVVNENEFNSVKLNSWQLKFFGTSVDASKAKRMPLPGDDDSESYKNIVDVSQGEDEKENTPESHNEDEQANKENGDDSKENNDNADGSDNNDGEMNHGAKSHYGEYFFVFIIIGFVVCLFYLKAASGRRPHRRRMEDYEFDIINPDSDDESRYSSSRFGYDSDNESIENVTENFEVNSVDEDDLDNVENPDQYYMDDQEHQSSREHQ